MRPLYLICMVALLGCGPSTARYRVDDSTLLGAVGVKEYQPVLAAQQEKELSRIEELKVGADLRNLDGEIGIAQNDYRSAQLQRDNAELQERMASQSGDRSRRDKALHDTKVSAIAVKAADLKVELLSKKRQWLRAQHDVAANHWSVADSKAELAKAKLAQERGIKPSESFSVTNFESEHLEKERQLSNANLAADRLKLEVDRLQHDYQSHVAMYEEAKGAAPQPKPAAPPPPPTAAASAPAPAPAPAK